MLIPSEWENPGPGQETDFRARMIEYIRTHFSKLLGKDVALLDEPDGLEILHQKYVMRNHASGRKQPTLARTSQ